MTSDLDRIAQRLSELAALLRDPSIDDERAARLAAEAAELAAEAGVALDRDLQRAGDDEHSAAQEELL